MTQLIKKELIAAHTPVILGFVDGINVVKIEDVFYLIAQCDYGKAILFEIHTNMTFNRHSEPVTVYWDEFNVVTFGVYFPEFEGKVIERVNMEITFKEI